MTIAVETTEMEISWGNARKHGSWQFAPFRNDFDAAAHNAPVVGRSGVGTTTLLWTLAGLKKPDSGAVTWRFPGETVTFYDRALPAHREARIRRDVRRRHFSFAFQDASLVEFMTVQENLVHACRMRRPRVRTADAIAEAEAIVRSMGVPGKDVPKILAMYPGRLSGGEKQRMALAHAIIGDPTVVFADEPTGNLDPHTRWGIGEELSSWLEKRAGGTVLIWVTHHVDDPVKVGAGAVYELAEAADDNGHAPDDGCKRIEVNRLPLLDYERKFGHVRAPGAGAGDGATCR